MPPPRPHNAPFGTSLGPTIHKCMKVVHYRPQFTQKHTHLSLQRIILHISNQKRQHGNKCTPLTKLNNSGFGVSPSPTFGNCVRVVHHCHQCSQQYAPLWLQRIFSHTGNQKRQNGNECTPLLRLGNTPFGSLPGSAFANCMRAVHHLPQCTPKHAFLSMHCAFSHTDN